MSLYLPYYNSVFHFLMRLPSGLFGLYRAAELWANTHQQWHAWRIAFRLIQPTGESDIQSDNWGIDRLGVSGDIDKCGTEDLVSDGEDGCQRQNWSTSTRSSTPHWPLLSCLLYPWLFYLLSSVPFFAPSLSPQCFHLLLGSIYTFPILSAFSLFLQLLFIKQTWKCM